MTTTDETMMTDHTEMQIPDWSRTGATEWRGSVCYVEWTTSIWLPNMVHPYQAKDKGEAVAEIVSAHGDPEDFGERELIVRADIQKFPYGTKLYTSPK